jgi:hypothetical protein
LYDVYMRKEESENEYIKKVNKEKENKANGG